MKKLFALLLAGILCFTNTLSLQAATIDYDGTEVESKVSTQTICDTEVVSLHKTKKPKFKTGVPAILIIQLIIYFLFSGNEGIILRL